MTTETNVLGDHPDLDFDSGYKGHIVARIRTDQIEWTFKRNEWTDGKGTVHPAEPDKTIFEEGLALAVLLANEAVFVTGLSEEKKFDIQVLCNDVFMWGCADCEDMGVKDIESVYKHWIKDPAWGTAVWCILKRKEMPQKPVEKRIRDGGIWDLDALKTEHNLLPNYYDSVSHIVAELKYERYAAWQVSEGNTPLPWDKDWWSGWQEYTKAHPDWYGSEWKAEEERRISEWRSTTGWDKVPESE